MKWLFTFALFLVAATAAVANGCAQTATAADGGHQVVLDRVVAVINGDVLLESDVEEEMRFAAIEPFQQNAGKDTRLDAMRRLISRSLIVQQMKQQQQFNTDISDADMQKSLYELRSHLPQCGRFDCSTEAGWNAFLAAHDLTNEDVLAHWKQRLAILQFINLRFRTGIRIPQQSIEDYYAKSVVPAFVREHREAPPLKDVSGRIHEILLQQQVDVLLQDWLKSLRDEGSVQILDPEYASAADASTGSVSSED
jgi:hypothetical protein